MYADWNLMDDATKERLGEFAINLVTSAVMRPEDLRRVTEDAQQDLNPDDETPQLLTVSQKPTTIAVVQTGQTGLVPTTGAAILSAINEEVEDLYADEDEMLPGNEGHSESGNTGLVTQSQSTVAPVNNGAVIDVPPEPSVGGGRGVTSRSQRRQSRIHSIIMQSLQEGSNLNGAVVQPVTEDIPRDNFGGNIPPGLRSSMGIGSQPPSDQGLSVPGYNGQSTMGNQGIAAAQGVSNSGLSVAGYGDTVGVSDSSSHSALNYGDTTAAVNQGSQIPSSVGTANQGMTAPHQSVAIPQEAPGLTGQTGFGGRPLGSQSQQNVQTINPDMAQQPSQAIFANKLYLNTTRKSDEKNYVNPQNVGSVFENVKRSITPDEKKTAWADIQYDPQAGRTTVDGKPFEFKFIQKNVPWGSELTDDFEHNFMLMKKRITESVRAEFGGFGRIREIVVQDSRLFINRVMYCPMIDPAYISKLPQDLQSAMMNGNIAEFFDWSSLRHMRSLFSLSIDTSYFYCTTVLDDLGVSRRGGVSTVFKFVPSLELFSLAGETINRNNLGTPQSHNIKETVRKQKKNIAIMDGFKLNVYGAGDYLQDTCWASTKSYIDNRGNKNLFRFCGGLLLRGAAGTVATTGNAIVHTIGWGVKTIGSLLKAGMEPIDGSEHFTQ